MTAEKILEPYKTAISCVDAANAIRAARLTALDLLDMVEHSKIGQAYRESPRLTRTAETEHLKSVEVLTGPSFRWSAKVLRILQEDLAP